jgi:nitroimidazol reductase NimA-like FMN-containing flavoprotein (pyridoxamine 5'-phosphate oxidase superfamily)
MSDHTFKGPDGEALLRIQEQSYASAGTSLANNWPRERAMGAAALASFLTERRYCILATTNAKAHATARPVAFTVSEASFWFATVAGPRLRNVERTPWVSVVVADGEGDRHRAVAADGPVTIVSDPPDSVLAAWEAHQGNRASWVEAWFELTPARLLSYAARNA